MQTEAVFENIADKIQKEIIKAKDSIFIAVAWFTNAVLFDELIKKANEGCAISLIISNDDINLNSSINYNFLNIGKSKVYKIGDGKKELMHHKFCVIDHNVIITGSYNWSYKAENNFENIVITSDDSSLAQQFINEFNELIKQYYPNANEPITEFPLNKIVKRLEILKNYIVLEDIDELKTEYQKLKPYNFNTELNNIIELIKKSEFAEAINLIEEFISKHNQITTWTDPEISALKLEIKLLENQLISFDNEKTELERILSDFQRRHTIELGEIIVKILRLRKLKYKDDEKKFEEAENDENEYEKQYEQEKQKEVNSLTPEEELELKKLFRKAVTLCHPDKFVNELQEIQKEAEAISKELIEANDKKDLKKVNEILENLKKGILKANTGEKITDKERLRVTINKLKNKINDIETIIVEIKQSEQFQKINTINNWDEYFAKLKEQLSKELEFLIQEVN